MDDQTTLWGTGIDLEVPREAQSCMSHGIETLLTTKEASEVLKIHPKVLERMAKRGEVPALKVGKFWRYRATTLDAWINSRLQSGSQACRTATSF
jgi:excisionase family DNA binding protein